MPFWTLRRKLAAAVVVAIALALTWAAVVVAVALAAARDQAKSADAIVVLGAAQYNGRPSPVFRARLDHAAALYQRGLAPVVLVTGGIGSGDTVSESEVGRRYLLKAGLPESAVAALAAGATTSSFPDGSTGELEMIRHPGAAAVVPCASDVAGGDPTILMLKQYRYATGGPLWEIPAGTLAPGESPETCARRELLEEAGVAAERLDRLTSIWTTPGFTDEVIHLYLASGLTAGTATRDRDEFIEVVPQQLSRVLSAIRDGEIR